MIRSTLVSLTAAFSLAPALNAAVIPFTEDFESGPADWYDGAGAAPMAWSSTGGPDGSAFVSDTLNFANNVPEDTPLFARAQDEFGSSGGAFEGDWIDEGVTEFSFFVQHDAPAPLNFFTRFSSPANFPGAVAVEFVPVAPEVWTEISIAINPDNPQFVSFEGSDFETIFSNIGHIQLGVEVPDDLAGLDQDITFGLDMATIVPAPGGAAVMGLLGLSASRRRRRV